MLCAATAALAQRLENFRPGRVPAIRNAPYDGRFTFVRIKYETAPGGYWSGGRPSWVHGYPVAEENLMRIMNEISYLGPQTEHFNVLTLDDPDLFKYPDRLPHRGRLVDADGPRGRGAARVHREGRLRHRRRLQAARLARQQHRRVGAVRGQHEAGAARRPVLRHGRLASDLPLILRDQHRHPRQLPAGVQRRASRSSAACTKTTTRASVS